MDPTTLLGRSLGGFEVVERMAGGGFGEVFRARQATLGRDAVVKVLKHSGKVVRERFTQEAQLASRLDHPYAAHIYAFGAESDGLQWIAMELVRGTSLAELLRAQGPLPLPRFLPLFRALCEVVQAAHEQHIVHRDIKPANVMVVARGGVLMPKLLDFGIARISEAHDDRQRERAEQELEKLLQEAEKLRFDAPSIGDARATEDDTVRLNSFDHELDRYFAARRMEVASRARDGNEVGFTDDVHVGSPAYMAPELWIGPYAAGPPCDIYALGVLAYECLTRKLPFDGKDPLDMARSHLVDKLPALPRELPEALHAALDKAVAKRASERHGDALSLCQAVESACATAVIVPLPRLPPDLSATVLARAPQPIAEALGAADAARRVEDAWPRYVGFVELACQYAGNLALSAHARLGQSDAGEELAEAIRAVGRASVSGAEWLALATAATRPFVRLRDAFPLPELVDVCHSRGESRRTTAEALAALLELIASFGGREVDVAELAGFVDAIGKTLVGFVELFEYDLAVHNGIHWERWVGQRRRPRVTTDARIDAPDGAAVLLDRNGAALLSLWPIVKAIAPTPGAEPELFLFAGPGRYGARLVAQPAGFERQEQDVAEWVERLAGTHGATHAAAREERAPYRGLASFSVADSELFFGRERESEHLANHLRARAFAAVVGPSGAGKSSFVQAGVVPLFPTSWKTVVLRPGPRPLAALRDKLLPLVPLLPEIDTKRELAAAEWIGFLDEVMRKRGETLVIVVDQAEELVTLSRDEASRLAFAQLVAAVRDEARVRVVLTLRDDFLMRMQRLPGLGERLTNGIHLLGTPSRGDLRRILTEPARRMGYELEDAELVDEMVGAVADNPSALALLSFTAARMWELRDRQFRKLRRKVYTSIGGVGGALAQHAEDVILKMAPEERELVREAFRLLVTADGTRAVIARSELLEGLGGGAAAARVIETLVQARLAVSAEAEGGTVTIEITHEALLGSWPRLVSWRRDDAETARLRDQLRASARQWDARGRQRGLLWRGDVLVEYRLWRARYRGRLTELEQHFSDACLKEDARRVRRTRTILAAVFAVLAAASIVLYVFAARARKSAAKATASTIELLTEQGRLDLLDHHPLHAATPLARAYELGGADTDLRFLVARAMTAFDSQSVVLRGHTGLVAHVAFTPDGMHVISSSKDGSVRLWDAASGQQITTTSVDGVPRITWTADLGKLALAGKGEASIRRTSDLSVITQWKLPAGAPVAIALCDDGSRAVVGTAKGDVIVLETDHEARALSVHEGPVFAVACAGTTWASGGADGRVLLGRGDAPPIELAHHSQPVAALALEAGKLAAGNGDGTIEVWAADTGAVETTYSGHIKPIRALAFAPGGKLLASASEDGTARLWRGPGELPSVLAGQGFAFSVVFDREGRQLLTTASDGTVRVWDAATGAQLATLDAHVGPVWSAAFDAAGNRIATAAFDQSVRIWTIPRPAYGIATAIPGGFTSATFDATGAEIVTGGGDGVARIYSAQGAFRLSFVDHHGPIRGLDISRDGKLLVTSSDQGSARLWSVEHGTVQQELGGCKGGAYSAQLRPDAREVSIACSDGVIRVFDVATGAKLRELAGHTASVWGIRYSSDGTLLASASDDRTVRLWNAATGQPVRTLGPLKGQVNAVAFDPTGERIVAVDTDGMLHVFRVATGELVAERFAHSNNIVAVAFNGDGTLLATASDDLTVAVWGGASLRELSRSQQHAQTPLALAFQPGAERLLSAGADGALWLTDVHLERRSPAEISAIVRAAP